MASSQSDIAALLAKQSFIQNKTNSFNTKSIILELYSCWVDYTLQETMINDEIISISEIGAHFRARYHQAEHFIYSADDEIPERLITDGKLPINLTKLENLMRFHEQLQSCETLIIIAKGDFQNQEIAGLDAELFIEHINDELELKHRPLKHLELYSSNMGLAKEFREKLCEGLPKSISTITTYTTTLSAEKTGRLFIKLNNKEADTFYSENYYAAFTVTDENICAENTFEIQSPSSVG